MTEPLTRRDFLRLSGGSVGSVLVPPIDRLIYPDEREIIALLNKLVPRALQIDCLPNEKIVTFEDRSATWSSLEPDEKRLRAIWKMNKVELADKKSIINPGTTLILPESVNWSLGSDLARVKNFSKGLSVRLVMTPDTSSKRQFLPREFDRIDEMVGRVIIPFLQKTTPFPAVVGNILIGRAPDVLADIYDEDQSHVAVLKFDKVKSGGGATSYIRNSKEVFSRGNENQDIIQSRRIYLLRRLSDALKLKIETGDFLMSSEWSQYYFSTMWDITHELLHAITTSDYRFPPFDNHSFVRALSLSCVLEYESRGKGWRKGKLPDELWLMPELEVVKLYPEFYQDLFNELRRTNFIWTRDFSEDIVRAVSESLFQKRGLGSFAKLWEFWSARYPNKVGSIGITPVFGAEQLATFSRA